MGEYIIGHQSIFRDICVARQFGFTKQQEIYDSSSEYDKAKWHHVTICGYEPLPDDLTLCLQEH